MAVLIAVIVILITGLIVLTIFGGSIGRIFGPGFIISGDVCKDACTAYQQICLPGDSRQMNELPGCTDAARTEDCLCPRQAEQPRPPGEVA